MEVYATYKLSTMHCLPELWPWFNKLFGAKVVALIKFIFVTLKPRHIYIPCCSRERLSSHDRGLIRHIRHLVLDLEELHLGRHFRLAHPTTLSDLHAAAARIGCINAAGCFLTHARDCAGPDSVCACGEWCWLVAFPAGDVWVSGAGRIISVGAKPWHELFQAFRLTHELKKQVFIPSGAVKSRDVGCIWSVGRR